MKTPAGTLLAAMLVTLAAAVPAAAAGAAKPKPKLAAVEQVDPKDLSAAFWTDWRAKRSSDGFVSLKKSAGSDDRVDPIVTASRAAAKQAVADIVISKPEDAARLMNAAVDNKGDSDVQAALKTVLAMRTTPAVRAQALDQIPAGERAQAKAFAANLSAGIPGLPGIYLGDQDQSQRPSAPAGYKPVAGSSGFCPQR